MSTPGPATSPSPLLPTEGRAPDRVETPRSRDGTLLRVCVFQAPSARGVVCVLHGYGDHAGRYTRLAGDLNATGWTVATVDYRGHGLAEGPRGHCLRFTEYLEDVDTLLQGAARVGVPPRVILLGHSHGGLVALRYLVDGGEGAERAARHLGRPFDGVAVSNPFLALRMKVPAAKILLAEIAGRVAPRFAEASKIPAAHLSHEPSVVRAYQTDPLVHGSATAGWFLAHRAAQAEVREGVGRIRIPALFLLAPDDPITDVAVAREAFGRLGTPAGERTLRLYPGLYHEILNERESDRARVVQDLTGWLERR